jgi:uncharacterized protein (DUF2141 family)
MLMMMLAMASATGPLSVEVDNVRNGRGIVHVDICPKDRFLSESCPFSGDAPAHPGTVIVTVANVPAGQYAAQAFHDENVNHDIDRALFGIPKEGVGFSRNARIVFSPPKWNDAVFNHQARPEQIRFALRYFMGAKGPPPAQR